MQKLNLLILSPCYSSRHEMNQSSISSLAHSNLFNRIELVEVYGYSEVSRARNICATRALLALEDKSYDGQVENTIVFWFDSDMVILSNLLVADHASLVHKTGVPISGAYVQRKKQNKLAASIDDSRIPTEICGVLMTPVLAGMGCLMLTAYDFIINITAAKAHKDEEGALISYMPCYPSVEPIDLMVSETNYHMLGEDYTYCRNLGGVWIAEDKNFHYGHICEIIAAPKDAKL